MPDQTAEALLTAWLRLNTAINNERISSQLPYNEAVLCNLLYKNRRECPDQKVTATDLCRQMKMLKSQMNRTLTSLEAKNIIRRERSPIDKRQIWISLEPKQALLYEKQHQEVLSLINMLLERIGRDRADEIITLFDDIADTADEILGGIV